MEYFKKALSDFTQDVACGGAIRHLTDIGYTARQIADELDFPTPYTKVQELMWRHLLESGVILLEEPGCGKRLQKPIYVKEYGKFGKVSFRKIPAQESNSNTQINSWKEYRYQPVMGDLRLFLQDRCEVDDGKDAYASIDLDWVREVCTGLDLKGTEYLLELPQKKGLVYHQLDQRMRDIVCELYGRGQYEGTLYFMSLQEKVSLCRKE